jgi:peptide/nickel transport system permease protein
MMAFYQLSIIRGLSTLKGCLGMSRFYTGKIMQYLIILVLTITLNFLLPRLMPGNPLVYLAGEDVGLMSAAEKEHIMEANGLNKPLVEQYVSYLGNVLTGNFGFSYQKKLPISEMIMNRLPWTLMLCGFNLLLSTLIGVIVGALSAWKRGSKTDISLLTGFMFISAMPSFWVGMILVSMERRRRGANYLVLTVYGISSTIWCCC